MNSQSSFSSKRPEEASPQKYRWERVLEIAEIGPASLCSLMLWQYAGEIEAASDFGYVCCVPVVTFPSLTLTRHYRSMIVRSPVMYSHTFFDALHPRWCSSQLWDLGVVYRHLVTGGEGRIHSRLWSLLSWSGQWLPWHMDWAKVPVCCSWVICRLQRVPL